MRIRDNITCCGVRELEGVQGEKPSFIVECVACDRFAEFRLKDYSIVLFTVNEHGKKTVGTTLPDYIEKHGLGSVVETKKIINQNTGNKIKAFLWSISERGLKKWIRENKINFKQCGGSWSCSEDNCASCVTSY